MDTSIVYVLSKWVQLRQAAGNPQNVPPNFYIYELHVASPAALDLLVNPPGVNAYNVRLASAFGRVNPHAAPNYLGGLSPMADLARSGFCGPSYTVQMYNANLARPGPGLPLPPPPPPPPPVNGVPVAPVPNPNHIVANAQQLPNAHDGWRSPWDQNEVMLCPSVVGQHLRLRHRYTCTLAGICGAIYVKDGFFSTQRVATLQECESMFVRALVGTVGQPAVGYDMDIDHKDSLGSRPTAHGFTHFRLGSNTPTVTRDKREIIDLETIVTRVCQRTNYPSIGTALI